MRMLLTLLISKSNEIFDKIIVRILLIDELLCKPNIWLFANLSLRTSNLIKAYALIFVFHSDLKACLYG